MSATVIILFLQFVIERVSIYPMALGVANHFARVCDIRVRTCKEEEDFVDSDIVIYVRHYGDPHGNRSKSVSTTAG